MPRTRSCCRRTSAPERARERAPEGGFTVAEIVFTVSLLMVVVGALLGVLDSAHRTQSFVYDRADALDEMRLTLDRMTKEVRQAGSVALDSTASRLEVSTYVGGEPETIVYEVSGTDLVRSVDGGQYTVVHEKVASSDLFQYEPAVETAQVVKMVLRVHPSNSPDTTLELSSEVQLRNRGSA